LNHHSRLAQFFIDALLPHNINGLVEQAPHIEGFVADRAR